MRLDANTLLDEHGRMEVMRIFIKSVVERDGRCRGRARAVAECATICVEVTFELDRKATRADIWERARDEVLRCLDIA